MSILLVAHVLVICIQKLALLLIFDFTFYFSPTKYFCMFIFPCCCSNRTCKINLFHAETEVEYDHHSSDIKHQNNLFLLPTDIWSILFLAE